MVCLKSNETLFIKGFLAYSFKSSKQIPREAIHREKGTFFSLLKSALRMFILENFHWIWISRSFPNIFNSTRTLNYLFNFEEQRKVMKNQITFLLIHSDTHKVGK